MATVILLMQFFEMMGLSLGVVGLSFVFGLPIREFLGARFERNIAW